MKRMRLAIFLDRLRGSYWFVPLGMTLVAVALAVALYQLDQSIPNSIQEQRWFLLKGNVQQTRAFLSLAATTLLSVIGVVFSMTLVVLTMTASQFGSFLLRAFMRDNGTQKVLGTYCATVAYCITLLMVLAANASEDMGPLISHTFAMVLFLVSLAMLVYFFDHAAGSFQTTRVVALVGNELAGTIEQEMGATQVVPDEGSGMIESRRESIRLSGTAIPSTGSGYIRAFDYDGLARVARSRNLVFLVTKMTGDFVAAGQPFLLAWPPGETDVAGLTREANRMCLVGENRTMLQDPRFGISQLVVIASRALSPAVNDPMTAMMCIDRLGESLRLIAGRRERMVCRYDGEKVLRLIGESYNFELLVGSAFDLIRQYGRGTAEIALRLFDAIGSIAPACRTEAYRQVLLQHARLIEVDSRSALQAEYDRQRVRQAFEETVKAIDLPVTG